MAERTTDDGLVINGKSYTDDDLTFREQREVRRVMRDLLEDPDADVGDATMVELVPAFAFVVLKRDQPDLTIDDILDMSPKALAGSSNGNGASARPTRASGTSGRRKSQPNTA